MKKNSIALVLLASILLVSGCVNPYQKSQTPTPATNTPTQTTTVQTAATTAQAESQVLDAELSVLDSIPDPDVRSLENSLIQ